jgi:hypothetical protein
MSPFINQWPFYPQASLEKLPRTAPPLNRNSHTLRQLHPYQRLLHMCWCPYPPPSIKATPGPDSLLHHLFPSQPGSLGLPLNFALWTWDFSCELSLRAVFFLTVSISGAVEILKELCSFCGLLCHWCGGQDSGTWEQITWVQILPLSLMNCVTLNKTFIFLCPRERSDNNGIHLIRWLWGLICAKGLRRL